MRKPVLLQRDGTIATVVLNNPDKLNALNKTMWVGLGEVMASLSNDETLRGVVLRGAGDKAFAAGADISEFTAERSDSHKAKRYGEIIDATMRTVAECPHPTVALIRGACVGGGLEIASQCDLRICGESSRFGVPINKLGLVMGYGELQGLLSLVGRSIALEILLEGRVFGAQEAKQIGLVTRVVSDDTVEEEAYAAAQRVAEGAPLVARWHKQFINRLADPTPLSQAERDEAYACFDSEDFKIGRQAFLAKTKPRFEGR